MLVQSSARRAEEEVFTRTGCFLCHTYREKPLSDQRVDETRYTITAPNIPAVWMTKARFDHGAHEELSCESCHEKTRTSTETKDLLLPSIAVCRECHMEGAKAGFVESDCTQCHAYHAALEVPREKKQSLTDFLHTLTR
jgi:predicted CXXCH cytochrome family protein